MLQLDNASTAQYPLTSVSRSVPGPDLEIRRRGGAVSPKCFRPFGPQFGLKISRPPPLIFRPKIINSRGSATVGGHSRPYIQSPWLCFWRAYVVLKSVVSLESTTASCKNVETLRRGNDLSCFKSLLVTGL